MKKAALLLFVAIFAAPALASALTLDQLQKDLKAAGATWTAGYTEPAMEHEFNGRNYAGPLDADLVGAEVFERKSKEDPPAYWDWRDIDGVNYVPTARNQGNCGSCWAFATTGPIEIHIAYAENWPDPQIDLSEEQLLSCWSGGCNGGFTTSSFDYARDTGLTREACFRYTAAVQSCDAMCDEWQDDLFKIDRWQLVTTNPWAVDQIKAALLEGALATSISIYEDFYYYEEGVYQHVSGGFEGFHAVTIVGYDDSDESWIVRNSWGGLWGEQGFGKIGWGAAGIGLVTIIPYYTSQGLGPEGDDDDSSADDSDDETADDSDDDTTPAPADGGDDDDDDDSGCGC